MEAVFVGKAESLCQKLLIINTSCSKFSCPSRTDTGDGDSKR